MSRVPVLSVFLFFAVGAVTGFVRQNKATTVFFSQARPARTGTKQTNKGGERVTLLREKKALGYHVIVS